tara:strand:+ start:200 stop:433 length:234 start_codon:yes stop_codon:yes gene_type:complete
MKIEFTNSEFALVVDALDLYTSTFQLEYNKSGEVDWIAGEEAENADRLRRRLSNMEVAADGPSSASIDPFGLPTWEN